MISIIVPVYQVEKYIGRCISSIIGQDFINFEVICVDDGTKDGSCKIIEEFMKSDSRIKLFHKKNGGLSSARNEGLRHAEGEYVWFIDSDDYIVPRACSVINREILEHRSDIITFGAEPIPSEKSDVWLRRVLSPGYWVIEDRGEGESADRKSEYLSRQDRKEYRPFETSVRAFVRYNGAWPFVWRCAFKREFLNRTGLTFDEHVKFGEDTVFMSEAYPQTKRISFIPDHLYYYRCARTGSLMDSNKDPYDRMMENCKIAVHVLQYWKEKGWSKLFGDYCLEWTIHFIGYDAIKFKDVRKKRIIALVAEIIRKYELDQYAKSLPFYEKTVYARIQLQKHVV